MNNISNSATGQAAVAMIERARNNPSICRPRPFPFNVPGFKDDGTPRRSALGELRAIEQAAARVNQAEAA